MKLTEPKLTGPEFGNLGVYIRGIITYRLSPFEQKVFPSIAETIPKLARRMTGNLVYTVPPFALAYLIYSTSEKKFYELNRKNPADYANDK